MRIPAKKRRVEDGDASEPKEEMEILASVRLVSRLQPRVQALDHVVALLDQLADCCSHWTLPMAVKAKDKRLIDRVLRHTLNPLRFNNHKRQEELERAMAYAAAMGNLQLVQQLFALVSTPLNKQVAMAAALHGDLKLLQWVKDVQPDIFHHNVWAPHVAFDVAAERGCLETVKWLVESFPETVSSLGPAALGGHLDVVEWLHDHADLDTDQVQLQIGILSSLTFVVCSHFVQECQEGEKEELQAAQWRFKDRRAPTATDAMDWAAYRGHLDVLQWLRDNRNEGCSPAAANKAAEAGNMEILLWLRTNYRDQWAPAVMDHAARGGHLEVVKWIAANCSEGCSTSAMDWAAELGNLDVVKWLHEHRSEGCTIAAMDNAAKNGHLDVVKWLHENRSEGCTSRAMDWAAEFGHLETVEWLHGNRSEGCTTTAVDHAAGHGNLDVIQFLYANRTEGGTAMAIVHAHDYNHPEVLQWFEEEHINLPIPGEEDD